MGRNKDQERKKVEGSEMRGGRRKESVEVEVSERRSVKERRVGEGP